MVGVGAAGDVEQPADVGRECVRIVVVLALQSFVNDVQIDGEQRLDRQVVLEECAFLHVTSVGMRANLLVDALQGDVQEIHVDGLVRRVTLVRVGVDQIFVGAQIDGRKFRGKEFRVRMCAFDFVEAMRSNDVDALLDERQRFGQTRVRDLRVEGALHERGTVVVLDVAGVHLFVERDRRREALLLEIADLKWKRVREWVRDALPNSQRIHRRRSADW